MHKKGEPMPKPIICGATALSYYACDFRACFSKRQYQYFVTILLALIECQERRTLSALLRTVSPQLSLSGLSRFMGRWDWSPDALAQVWLARFRCRLAPLVLAEHARLALARSVQSGRPLTTVVTGFLSLDDSVHTKPRGKRMGGLGKHYSNCEKRLVTGHCLFGAIYEVLEQRCPLLPRLYCQKATCEAEGRPFLSKIALAIQTVLDFVPVAQTVTHVLVDSWYHCNDLRKATRLKGYELSGALKSNRRIRVRDAADELQWLSLSLTDWQKLEWPGMHGNQPIYVHTLRTQVSKLGATLIVLTRLNLEGSSSQVRYWGSTLLEADAQTVLDCLAKRWAVEVFFEDAKDLLGSDHYQLLRTEAICRFWALVALVGSFLDEQRAILAAETNAHSSWGQRRQELQAQHRRNLLQWLEEQFRAGRMVAELNLYLAV
jgi:hypothetical protein